MSMLPVSLRPLGFLTAYLLFVTTRSQALDVPYETAPYINATHPVNSTDSSIAIWTRNGTRNATAPYLSGIFFEDIAHSGDGGIYAELIRNRAFQGSGVTFGAGEPSTPGVIYASAENPTLPFGPVLDGWYAIGDGVNISLDLLHPLSNALQVSLQVDVPLYATGEVGIKNDGYWGMEFRPQTYSTSFWCTTDGYRWNWTTLTHFDVSLRDNLTGEVFASNTIDVTDHRPVPYMYKNYSTTIPNTARAPTTNNSFYLTMSGEEVAGQTLYFDLISLFPETYKGRHNGLRKDLAEGLAAADFKFLRFPGGNNLEGYSIQRRWKWWETIGPLKDRPGRPGDWTYYNTDGLGLLEYMYWCEDMNLVPLLGVYAGFSLDQADYDNPGNSTDSNELPVEFMEPILREALSELEFLTGDPQTTHWGGIRAKLGHPEPFDVPYVEIGNEDFFSHDYPARATYMLDGLRAQHPNITYIYTAANLYPQDNGNFNITLPSGTIWDDHVYDQPSYFVENFNQFDNWPQSTDQSFTGPADEIYAALMEYHVSSIDNRTGDPSWNITTASVTHPRMLSAVAEAVYALGWERNPNTFKLSAFAPAIQNVNMWRETPYLILFDADPRDNLYSVSYWQERMFSLHHGTETLPTTTVRGGFNPLFWAAAIDTTRNEVYLKVVNAGGKNETFEVALDVEYESVNGTVLEPPTLGDLNAFNDFNNKTAIVPKPISALRGYGVGSGGGYNKTKSPIRWSVPAYSVNVVQFNLATNASGAGTYAEPRASTGKRSSTQLRPDVAEKDDERRWEYSLHEDEQRRLGF